MTRLLILFFMSGVLACANASPELAIECSRVVMAPGTEQTISIEITNNSNVQYVGTLQCSLAYDLDENCSLGMENITLMPGAAKSLQYKWKAVVPYWGCSARATLKQGTDIVQQKECIFTVTHNQIQSGAAFGTSHSIGSASEERIRSRVKNFAINGITAVEFWNWNPSNWGQSVYPSKDIWKCQTEGGFTESLRAAKIFLDEAHKRGIKVYLYTIPWFTQEPGIEIIKKHPDWVIYANNDGKIDMSEPAKFRATVNPYNQNALDSGLIPFGRLMKEIGFDGVRFDGLPGIFYDPVMAWIYKCNGGTLQQPYDVNGQSLLPSAPDSFNASIAKYCFNKLREIGGQEKLIGVNCKFGQEYYDWNNMWPQFFRTISHDNFTLQERHFHANSAGEPYIGVCKSWSQYLEDGAYTADMVRMNGGYLYRGDFGGGTNLEFSKHAAAYCLAAGSRIYAMNPWYSEGNGWGHFPFDFIRFALRFGKYIYAPELTRIDPEKPFQRISVSSNAPFRPVYKRTCYDRFADGKFTSIIHLLNPPLSDGINVKIMHKTPYVQKDVIVSFRQPPLYDKSKAVFYALSPEISGWKQKLEPEDQEKNIVNLKVPSFQYWMIIVCEYPVSDSGTPHAAKYDFVPVIYE